MVDKGKGDKNFIPSRRVARYRYRGDPQSFAEHMKRLIQEKGVPDHIAVMFPHRPNPTEAKRLVEILTEVRNNTLPEFEKEKGIRKSPPPTYILCKEDEKIPPPPEIQDQVKIVTPEEYSEEMRRKGMEASANIGLVTRDETLEEKIREWDRDKHHRISKLQEDSKPFGTDCVIIDSDTINDIKGTINNYSSYQVPIFLLADQFGPMSKRFFPHLGKISMVDRQSFPQILNNLLPRIPLVEKYQLKRILFADDNKDLATITQHYLKEAGYHRTEIATSLKETIDKIKEGYNPSTGRNSLDLLITDNIFPSGEGMEAIELAQYMGVPNRVLVSAQKEADMRFLETYLDGKINSFVAKGNHNYPSHLVRSTTVAFQMEDSRRALEEIQDPTLILLTGEKGVGKTTMNRALTSQLNIRKAQHVTTRSEKPGERTSDKRVISEEEFRNLYENGELAVTYKVNDHHQSGILKFRGREGRKVFSASIRPQEDVNAVLEKLEGKIHLYNVVAMDENMRKKALIERDRTPEPEVNFSDAPYRHHNLFYTVGSSDPQHATHELNTNCHLIAQDLLTLEFPALPFLRNS